MNKMITFGTDQMRKDWLPEGNLDQKWWTVGESRRQRQKTVKRMN